MARHKVAVIIPYRDREEHLSLLLYHLHPMLRKQQLDYTVIVVEQVSINHAKFALSVFAKCPIIWVIAATHAS